MTDRRQHRRFILDEPLPGELQVSVDVEVEHLGPHVATVLTRTPSLLREPVLLRLLTVGGQVQRMPVRACKSLPINIDGMLWQRVHYERLEADGGDQAGPDVAPPRLQDVLTCVVVRTLPARLRQVSANGCLLETPFALAGGKFARLDVQVPAGERYGAMLRICRQGGRGPGSSLAHVAAEFVPLYEDTGLSIQQFIGQHAAGCAR